MIFVVNTMFMRLLGKKSSFRQAINVTCYSSNGITPGGRYSASEMRSALEDYFGASVYLGCSSGTLSDVELFFYVKGRDTYQITDAVSTGSCSGSVEYPTK